MTTISQPKHDGFPCDSTNPPTEETYITDRWQEPLFIEGGDPFDLSGGCTLDGMPTSCSAFNRMIWSESVNTQYQGIYTRNNNGGLQPLQLPIRYLGLGMYLYDDVRLTWAGEPTSVVRLGQTNNKPTLDMIKKALTICIPQLYPHYELVNFTPTKKPVGANGKSEVDDKFNGVTKLRDKTNGIEFDIVNDPTPPDTRPFSYLQASLQKGGITDLENPWWNYTSPVRDEVNFLQPGEIRYKKLWVDGGFRFVRTQIHELGAALGTGPITRTLPNGERLTLGGIEWTYHGGDYTVPPNDLDPTHPDNGPALEDCVGREVYKMTGDTPAPGPF